jgi:hypothetical protein
LKYSNELQAALKRADGILRQRTQAQTALEAKENELHALLDRHAAAERSLEAGLADQAVGGEVPAAARDELATCVAALDEAGATVNGLRTMLTAQEGELTEALAQLEEARPPFGDAVRAAFERKAAPIIRAYHDLLAESVLLSDSVGPGMFEIPRPMPSEGITLPADVAAPGEAARGIRTALGQIAEAARLKAAREKRVPPTFVAAARYRAVRDFAAGAKMFRRGDVVLGGEFDTGLLAALCQSRHVVAIVPGVN